MSNHNPTTSKIMVIRHAEKPTGNYQGINVYGTEDEESLIVQGWQRAGALVALFDPFNGPLQNTELAVPDVLYASVPRTPGESKKKYSKSERPLETITPLSQRLQIDINLNYGADEYKDMADDAMAQTGTVLIAWQHSDIPHIANHIQAVNTAPQSWPDDRFDVVWVFDLDESTGTYSFSQVPQNLLAGDQNTGIPYNS